MRLRWQTGLSKLTFRNKSRTPHCPKAKRLAPTSTLKSFLINKGTVNTNKTVIIIILAAQRLLQAIMISSSYRRTRDISVTYHFLSAMSMAVMGLQLRPRGTTVSVEMRMFLAISAPCPELEFWRLLQQYSEALHLAELFKGQALLTADKGNPGGENIHCGGILGIGRTFGSVGSGVGIGGGVSVGGRVSIGSGGTGYSEGTNSQSDNDEEGLGEHFYRLERIEVKSLLSENLDVRLGVSIVTCNPLYT